jgi:disulfide bond formation protein DsbB
MICRSCCAFHTIMCFSCYHLNDSLYRCSFDIPPSTMSFLRWQEHKLLLHLGSWEAKGVHIPTRFTHPTAYRRKASHSNLPLNQAFWCVVVLLCVLAPVTPYLAAIFYSKNCISVSRLRFSVFSLQVESTDIPSVQLEVSRLFEELLN